MNAESIPLSKTLHVSLIPPPNVALPLHRCPSTAPQTHVPLPLPALVTGRQGKCSAPGDFSQCPQTVAAKMDAATTAFPGRWPG